MNTRLSHLGSGLVAATLTLGLAACASPTAAPAEPAGGLATEGAMAAISAPESQPMATEAGVAQGLSAPATKLNLNTATQEELLTVPGAGARFVREFNEYRPYASILEFRQELGKYIDAAQVAEFEKYLFVPVKVNDADEATLQQLPGVTADVAAQLTRMRPFPDNGAFLAALGQLASPEDANAAAAMLEPQ
jgi:DNA uptake protein ComE-like DNA-binding protein